MDLAALPLVLSLLWPQPRQAEIVPDTLFRLPVQIEVSASADLAGPTALLRRELARIFGPGAIVPAGGAITDKGGTVIRLALAPADLTHPEEYTVEPGAGGVLLRAHDGQGAFWAVHTLAALLEQARHVPEGYRVTIPRLRDWPDTPFRAFMIQGAWTPDVGEFKRNLDLLARQHVTYFALEFGSQVVLDFDPKIAEGGRLTKAQAREVIEYGRSLGLKPIAYLNMLGHLDRAYKKEPYTQHGGIDIRNEATYEKFVYPILSEMLEVYGPVEYFHCGMDEAWELFTWLSQDGYDVTGLLAQHIQRVDSFLKAHGVKLVIWHDMLVAPDLEKKLGAPIGPANGGPPQNTAAALVKIPKDVILDYWFYDPLAKYPALDYLKAEGFTVWASPWQTPFSLARYAQARQVPVMGTLWCGPPDCFASSTYNPVTAYYAQAVWNAAAAPAEVSPEPHLTAAAQRATSAALWGRRAISFPSTAALLLSSDGPKRVAWPSAGVEQHSGVPLDTAHPVDIKPLPPINKPLSKGVNAASVVLPSGGKLTLDGVNKARGEDQLILYTAPRDRTGTNIYGVEVSVSATGVVLEPTGYGAGDHAIPAGGFVLSAHLGPNPEKGQRLQALRPGQRVAVLDAQGQWLGGDAPTQLLAELPGGRVQRIDGEDEGRGSDQLVLYHGGYGDGHTGTNQWGVEAIVSGGKVVSVQTGKGNAAIPADGYVLSGHGQGAAALAGLKEGDAVRLLLDRGGQQSDLAAALAERRRAYPVGAQCKALYLAVSAGASSAPGTALGRWVVRYADGTTERIPVRYGREALAQSADSSAQSADSLPQTTNDPVWLIEQGGTRCLVREWVNPHPEKVVREVAFEAAPALLDLPATIVAATAAVEG